MLIQQHLDKPDRLFRLQSTSSRTVMDIPIMQIVMTAHKTMLIIQRDMKSSHDRERRSISLIDPRVCCPA